jgi:tRNA(Ile)-lysidine synthase
VSDLVETLPRRLQRAYDAHAVGGRVLLAVSGGADSVALLRGTLSVAEQIGVVPLVAHLNHGLRGAESDADAEFVSQLAVRLDVPAVVRREDVPEPLVRETGSREDAARQIRYAFLARVAEETGCRFVAVAHTADDQAETVLHHVLRGTGLAGLSGMPAERELSPELSPGVRLVRPMLRTSRQDVLAYLDGVGQPFREDLTNQDPQFTRNRLRTDLLPRLQAEYNPRVHAALCRLAEQGAEVQAELDRQAAALLASATIRRGADEWLLDCAALQTAAPVLIRTALVQLWKQASWPRRALTFEHLSRLDQLARRDQGTGGVSVSGVEITRRRKVLILKRSHPAPRDEKK